MADTTIIRLVPAGELLVSSYDDETPADAYLVVLASDTIKTNRVYPVVPYARTITQVH